MVAAAKFTAFLEKAAERLTQYQQSLLRHAKNPDDREFLNDINRSVHSIKNAALPVGLGRISELCFHLENFLQRVRQERREVTPEKIDILAASKDRLDTLLHDIEVSGGERATVKDLLKRIQQEMEAGHEAAAPPTEEQTTSLPQSPAAEPAPALESLAPALETLPAGTFVEEESEEESLLPDEIRNQEYDRELFQIFIEQMQENISLLRTLANGYTSAASKAKTIALCSELAGKLQSSANYMGYERLADYFIQWVAELEMAGVELSMGSPVSLAFMDERIRTITDLFPQIKDVPASGAAVRKAEGEMVSAQSLVREKKPVPAEPAASESFKDLFGSMDEGEDEAFAADTGPIAALAGFEPEPPARPAPVAAAPEAMARKKRMQTPSVELDTSFLEEERQSPEFDEELFQIFVQQLQENLSQLLALVRSYPVAGNKGAIVNQCSTLLGKLQSSANYMGYEQLAEYYLQWIAELEMAGVDLTLGTTVSFAFMDDKIRRIIDIFPQIKDTVLPAAPIAPAAEPPPAPKRKAAPKEPDESESFKELFIGMDDEEDEIFDPASVPVAALTEFQEEGGWELAALAEEADLPEVHAFFGEPDKVPSAAGKPAAPAFDVDDLFGEGEETAAPEPEPIAALAEAEVETAQREVGPAGEMNLPELDAFFGDLGVATPPAAQKEGFAPAPAFGAEELFAEPEAAPAVAPVAETTLPAVEDFFTEFAEGKEEEAFAESGEPIAALSGEDFAAAGAAVPPGLEVAGGFETLFSDELGTAQPADIPGAEDIEELFSAAAGGDDLDFEAADETLAALADSAAADLHLAAKPVTPARKPGGPGADIAALFGEEEEEPFPLPEELAPATAPPPPERQELFRKLSEALKSLDEEVPPLEETIARAPAKAPAPAPLPQMVAEAIPDREDQRLFSRLFGALAATAEDDDRGAAKPIDQVIEEILASESLPPALPSSAPVPELPRIATPDLTKEFGLDADRLDRLSRQIGELASGRTSLTHLSDEISSLSLQLQERHALDQDELASLRALLVRLEDTASALGRLSSILPQQLPSCQVLKVRAGSVTVALPLSSVEEIIRVRSGDLIRVDEGEMIAFRAGKIPLHSLASLAGSETPQPCRERFPVVVINTDAGPAGLIVDETIGLDEVAVQPLAEHLLRHGGIAEDGVKAEDDISFMPDVAGLVMKAQGAAGA